MNETENSEINKAESWKYNGFKLAVRLFTFLNFFLMLILISDFFLEPEYKAVKKAADTSENRFFSLSLGDDSLKLNSSSYEIKDNEQAAITPIFKIELYHKYKAKDNGDGFSVDLGPVFLPFISVLSWLLSFIAIIKPRDKNKGEEPALMYQLLLLPIIISLDYWVKLIHFILG